MWVPEVEKGRFYALKVICFHLVLVDYPYQNPAKSSRSRQKSWKKWVFMQLLFIYGTWKEKYRCNMFFQTVFYEKKMNLFEFVVAHFCAQSNEKNVFCWCLLKLPVIIMVEANPAYALCIVRMRNNFWTESSYLWGCFLWYKQMLWYII